MHRMLDELACDAGVVYVPKQHVRSDACEICLMDVWSSTGVDPAIGPREGLIT